MMRILQVLLTNSCGFQGVRLKCAKSGLWLRGAGLIQTDTPVRIGPFLSQTVGGVRFAALVRGGRTSLVFVKLMSVGFE